MTKPHLSRAYRGGDASGRPGWWIAFPYDPEHVERLKAAIPHTERVWSGEAKQWWVVEEHEATLDRLFANFGEFLNQGQLL